MILTNQLWLLPTLHVYPCSSGNNFCLTRLDQSSVHKLIPHMNCNVRRYTGTLIDRNYIWCETFTLQLCSMVSSSDLPFPDVYIAKVSLSVQRGNPNFDRECCTVSWLGRNYSWWRETLDKVHTIKWPYTFLPKLILPCNSPASFDYFRIQKK